MIDGLSQNKLNVFHWHLTDTQSFPLVLPSVPQLAQYGTYYDDEVSVYILLLSFEMLFIYMVTTKLKGKLSTADEKLKSF